MIITLLSGNKMKLRQYQDLQQELAPELFVLKPLPMDLEEIQSVNGEEVMREKMKQARTHTHLPFLVDDVSLTVNGRAYPGALVKHLLKQNDAASLPQFLPAKTPVTVTCFLGYFDGFEMRVFRGDIDGVTCDVSEIPSEGPLGLNQLVRVEGTLLGEVDPSKNHRGKAFTALVEHIQRVRAEKEQHDAHIMGRWDARATEWQSVREDATSYVNYEDGYVRFEKELKRILPLASGAALDIGCGDGAVTALVATGPEITDVHGMDLSAEMVKTAREKQTDPRIQFEVGTFTGSDRAHGLITSRGVVLSHMHQSDVIPTLTGMAAALAPNGYLVFDFISNLANNDDEGRAAKNQFTREWVTDVLSECGLVPVSWSGSAAQRVNIAVFHKPTETSLYFATGNATKVMELQKACANHTLHLANLDVAEVKHDDIVEVAKDKAKKSYELLKRPVVVTDGGIFIHALKGFPGPNSKQAATLLGPAKLLALLENEEDRSATRRNCMVFYDGTDYKVCVAEVPLVISTRVMESDHPSYPMDTILVPVHPENPTGLTYKEMPVEQRVQFTELPRFEEFIATL